jgi:O-antigen/teichoic acid export membrane protein
VTLATSLTVAGLAAAAVTFLQASLDPRLIPAFWIAMFIVPLRALIHVRSGVLLGLDRPVLGTAATTTVYPALLLVMVATLAMVDSEAHTAAWVVTLALGAVALTLFWASGATRRALGRLRPAQPGELGARTRSLLASSIPMMLITALGIVMVRADVITVGAVVGAEAAGVYFIASQLAFGLRFGMLAATPALSSVAASLHGAGARAALQAAVSGAARVVMAISGVAFLVLVLAGRQLLQLFGSEFTDGYPAMILLAGGTLFMMALGPVEPLLMMTGHERSAALSGGFATLANLALNVTLVPAFGLEGAAAATAMSGVAWVVVLNRRVVRHLGIHPGVLRLQRRRAD